MIINIHSPPGTSLEQEVRYMSKLGVAEGRACHSNQLRTAHKRALAPAKQSVGGETSASLADTILIDRLR